MSSVVLVHHRVFSWVAGRVFCETPGLSCALSDTVCTLWRLRRPTRAPRGVFGAALIDPIWINIQRTCKEALVHISSCTSSRQGEEVAGLSRRLGGAPARLGRDELHSDGSREST